MNRKNRTETRPLEIVEPIGKRILIRKDEDKKETKDRSISRETTGCSWSKWKTLLQSLEKRESIFEAKIFI